MARHDDRRCDADVHRVAIFERTTQIKRGLHGEVATVPYQVPAEFGSETRRTARCATTNKAALQSDSKILPCTVEPLPEIGHAVPGEYRKWQTEECLATGLETI